MDGFWEYFTSIRRAVNLGKINSLVSIHTQSLLANLSGYPFADVYFLELSKTEVFFFCDFSLHDDIYQVQCLYFFFF